MPADDPQTQLALAALDADAAARALSGGTPSRPSFAELYAYATDPAFEARPALLAALVRDPSLRAELRRLLGNVAKHSFPRQAAAASGAVARREVVGAMLALTISRADPGQAYLGIELTDPAAPPPSVLSLVGGDGAPVRLTLPAFAGGAVQMLLETAGETYRLLADPETEVFLI